MGFRDLLGKELLFFDGATGTMLQALGLQPGELPEPVSPALPEDRPPEKHFVGVKVIDGQEVGVYE